MHMSALILYASANSLFSPPTGSVPLESNRILGSRGGHGLSVLNVGRYGWGDTHFWCAAVYVVSAFAHMFLNWAWLNEIATLGHQ